MSFEPLETLILHIDPFKMSFIINKSLKNLLTKQKISLFFAPVKTILKVG